MDGLIKGLTDVVLGRDEQDNHETESRRRDDRSRSTWSEVVSGEHESHDRPSNSRTDYNTRPEGEYEGNAASWGGKVADRKNDNSNNDGWVTSHEKPFRQKEDDNNDGWETVSKKPSRRHHKQGPHNHYLHQEFCALQTKWCNKKVPKDQWKNYKCPSNEQDYSEEVSHRVDMEPSEEELANLKKAAYKLWELDLNRLVPGKDYEIDLGEGKKVYQKEDMAERSLFSWLSDEVFKRPTYARFCSLLDNYNPHQGYKEVVTHEEKEEQAAFMEEISRTAPIKYLHKYLSLKGIASGSYQDFKRMMSTLWFDLYGRGGTSSCSSAFEHVFVGEIKRGEQEVSGFHNWIQFYLEEEKGRVDYQGYIFPRRRGNMPDSEMQLLTIQFEWNGVLKAVSSTLIGVSPEFEIALYTLCFFSGGEDNYLELGPYEVNVKCYHHGNRLGSAFPVSVD